MNIIEPSVEILDNIDGKELLKKLESYGRTCYKSESLISDDSAEKYIRMILNRGHLSVIEHEKISARVICDRGVTHEIVRHRLASYSQESTRYCNYLKKGITFINPIDFELNEEDLKTLRLIEDHYNECIEHGRSPQQARYFLPNGLKTEIVITYNLREWRHFFTLRCDKTAHPQMRQIANMLLDKIHNIVPIIFDDLYIKYIKE